MFNRAYAQVMAGAEVAIGEHFDGRFELIDFVSFAREFPLPAEESAVELAEA